MHLEGTQTLIPNDFPPKRPPELYKLSRSDVALRVTSKSTWVASTLLSTQVAAQDAIMSTAIGQVRV